MPRLSAIVIYPFKSLDGLSVTEAEVLPSGAIAGDRQFAIVDFKGKFVNGKRYPEIHRLRSTYNPADRTIRLTTNGAPLLVETAALFHVDEDRDELNQWLSEYFHFPCQVVEDDQRGFPDDTQADGPTIISRETLEQVATWFPDLTVAETRRRFRANLEVEGNVPFWEDGLFGEVGRGIPFQVGDVEYLGTNPCQRCVVPTRCPDSGEPGADFVRIFMQRRKASLPTWTSASHFDHFYRLAVNTRLLRFLSSTRTLRVGATVTVGSTAIPGI
jgi:uncharacterized protein YcbX